jgi:DNA phosphorothioation-dependent restriction protein DptG
MKKKKLFINYKFKQLFIDKETKELVNFLCPGYLGEQEVIVLMSNEKRKLIHCPIEEFENKYEIDKEYIVMTIYKNGILRQLKIDPFNGEIEKNDISILASRAEKLLNNFNVKCNLVSSGRFIGHEPIIINNYNS